MTEPTWIDIVWIAMASMASLLGLMTLLVWARWRVQRRYLAFAVLCLCITACTVLEWHMFHAATPEEHAWLLRWAVTIVLPVVLGITWLVTRLAPTRTWLVVAVVATRVIATIANFATGDNLIYASVTGLHPVELWGDVAVAAPLGTLNPWFMLLQVNNVLLLALLFDSMRALLKQPSSAERHRNLRILAGILLLTLLSIGWNTTAALLDPPLFHALSPWFLGLMLVLTYELGSDILRSSVLAQRLARSESNLRDSRYGMLLAEREGRVGYWAWDLAGNRMELSPRARQVLGVATDGPFDLATLREDGNADGFETLRHIRTRVMEGGLRDFSTELRISLPDGSRRWLDLHGQISAGFDGAPSPLRAVGLILDHTERRGIEAHFQLVFASSPIAMLLADEDGRILLANAELCILSGYRIENLLGRTVETLVPSRQGDAHAAYREVFQRQAQRRAMGSNREVALRRADGEEVMVEVALNPIETDGRRHVIAAVTDIRQRRAQERELAQQRDSLAHLSRIGMFSELSGSLAHEINQPLAAILANAEASLRFLDRPVPDLGEVRDGLEEIASSSRRAGETIRKLRSMLRNEASSLAPLNLNEVVLVVLRILHGDLVRRHVQVLTRLQPDLPPVRGDSLQIQTVLLNLLMNAIESMAEVPSPSITVSTRLDAGGVGLDVSDIGSGIAADDLDRMFLPFVTTKASGLGLGLSLCKSLVTAHDGRLWATNNDGPGATLHVLLPSA
jgi:PAS domain S-box-containing protein